MSLLRALVGARINETMDNYSRADQLLASRSGQETPALPGTLEYGADQFFWEAVFADKQRFLNKRFSFHHVMMSEWIPRVPGLAHQPEWSSLRHITAQGAGQKPMQLDGLRVFQPDEKSIHVMGGVGTLRLPPNTDGAWLFSVSSGYDVAQGVLALVTADVWDKIQQNNTCEGLVISCTARWQPLAMEWSKHFRSTGSIPPGYFVLNDPDAVTVENRGAPVWIGPFSIMEYQSDASELLDYVYVISHTNDPEFRKGIAHFFEAYRQRFGGAGSRYLVAGDLVEDLWEAQYNTPADLLAQDSSAQSQLSLLMERVKERTMGTKVLDELLEKMKVVLSVDDLVRLAGEIEVEARGWQKINASLAEQCSQFLAAVCAAGKQDALLERLALEKPELVG